MMKNIEIVKIYRLLEVLKKENLSLKIRAKILTNLKKINGQIEVIKELEENIYGEELQKKMDKYNEKRNTLIAEYNLEGKTMADTTEDVMEKFNALELEFMDMFEEKNNKIKEHNEFLLLECEEEIEVIKFELNELDGIKLADEFDDILDLIVNLDM